jgi:hypothetical protein
VKQDSRLSHVPVILLTGAFDPFDQTEAERVGANGVLKKPFVPPDPLINLVKSLLPKLEPVAVEAGRTEFMSNSVQTNEGPRVAASTFFPVPAMPPPPPPRPRVESSVAIAPPPEPVIAKASKPQRAEEYPVSNDEEDDMPYAEQMRPAALDQILAAVKTNEVSSEADSAFGGVAAFPGLVDNEAPPRPPEKEPWSIRPPSTKDMVEHYWPPRNVEAEPEPEPIPPFRPSAFDTPQASEAAVEHVEEISATSIAPIAPAKSDGVDASHNGASAPATLKARLPRGACAARAEWSPSAGRVRYGVGLG